MLIHKLFNQAIADTLAGSHPILLAFTLRVSVSYMTAITPIVVIKAYFLFFKLGKFPICNAEALKDEDISSISSLILQSAIQ